ncbi:MAG: adenosine deaminase [Rickettsiales bacterium]|nr:MAG: adenosine deaminase [Rickettsiales bacterium]
MKDLHLHLSGSTDQVLLFEIINKMGLKLKMNDFFNFKNSLTMSKGNVRNLDEYLEICHIIDKAQSSPDAIKASFYKSYVDAAVLGCNYLELRWNPYKRSNNFEIDFDKLIVAARSGAEEAMSIFDIKGGQIFCLGRDVNIDGNDAIFKKALDYIDHGVIGIDVAGPESKCPLKPEFESYYKTAKAFGLMTTIHCGEENYAGVDDTLAIVIEKYKVDRIGHGIQIHRFPKLMKMAEKNKIMFEICISSNLMTQNVKTLEEYANIFKIFEENHLQYTICTDSVYTLGTNIVNEHELYNQCKEIAKKPKELFYEKKSNK